MGVVGERHAQMPWIRATSGLSNNAMDARRLRHCQQRPPANAAGADG